MGRKRAGRGGNKQAKGTSTPASSLQHLSLLATHPDAAVLVCQLLSVRDRKHLRASCTAGRDVVRASIRSLTFKYRSRDMPPRPMQDLRLTHTSLTRLSLVLPERKSRLLKDIVACTPGVFADLIYLDLHLDMAEKPDRCRPGLLARVHKVLGLCSAKLQRLMLQVTYNGAWQLREKATFVLKPSDLQHTSILYQILANPRPLCTAGALTPCTSEVLAHLVLLEVQVDLTRVQQKPKWAQGMQQVLKLCSTTLQRFELQAMFGQYERVTLVLEASDMQHLSRIHQILTCTPATLPSVLHMPDAQTCLRDGRGSHSTLMEAAGSLAAATQLTSLALNREKTTAAYHVTNGMRCAGLFSRCASLRSIAFGEFPLRFLPSSMSALQQLTRLQVTLAVDPDPSMDACTITSALRVLHELPLLQHLEVLVREIPNDRHHRVRNPEPPPPAEPGHLLLQSLQVMDISTESERGMDTPTLRRCTTEHGALQELLNHTFAPSIKVLYTPGCTLPASVILGFLSRHPSLDLPDAAMGQLRRSLSGDVGLWKIRASGDELLQLARNNPRLLGHLDISLRAPVRPQQVVAAVQAVGADQRVLCIEATLAPEALDDTVLEAVAQSCPHLQVLRLDHGVSSSKGILSLAALHGLQLLSLWTSQKHSQLDDECFRTITAGCTQLEWLELSGTRKVTDSAFRTLCTFPECDPPRCVKLHHLKGLRSCKDVVGTIGKLCDAGWTTSHAS